MKNNFTKGNTVRRISCLLMVALYVMAGINHFIHPGMYLKIMPPWIPYKQELNFITGVFEIGFALLLIFKATRRIGAWLLIALLIAIFPANIQMAINYYQQNHPQFWITIVRLPLQILLIWWAYTFTRDRDRH